MSARSFSIAGALGRAGEDQPLHGIERRLEVGILGVRPIEEASVTRQQEPAHVALLLEDVDPHGLGGDQDVEGLDGADVGRFDAPEVRERGHHHDKADRDERGEARRDLGRDPEVDGPDDQPSQGRSRSARLRSGDARTKILTILTEMARSESLHQQRGYRAGVVLPRCERSADRLVGEAV